MPLRSQIASLIVADSAGANQKWAKRLSPKISVRITGHAMLTLRVNPPTP